MIFAKMAACTVLFWILMSLRCVHGQDQLFQAMYNAVSRVFSDKNNKIVQPLNGYIIDIAEMSYDGPAAVIVQNTSTSLYILDTCGLVQSQIYSLIGYPLSYLLAMSLGDDGPVHIGYLSEIDTLYIKCDDVFSYGYNISLVSSKNDTIIDAVTTYTWSGTTLTSLFPEGSLQFDQVKRISVTIVPITELSLNDLIRFPQLRTLMLTKMPIASMADGLLCYTNITIFLFVNSLGYLTTFPQQMFNCTAPLKLEFF